MRCLGGRSPKSQDSYPGSPRPFSSPSHKASSSQPYLTGTVQHYSQCENFTYLWGERGQRQIKGKKIFLSFPDLSTNIHQLTDTISTPMFESVSAAQTKAHHTDVPLKARCNKNTKQCLYYYLIEKSGSPEPVVSCSTWRPADHFQLYLISMCGN